MNQPREKFFDTSNDNDVDRLHIDIRGYGSICIYRTDEGVCVDVLSKGGEIITSTYAFFEELNDNEPPTTAA